MKILLHSSVVALVLFTVAPLAQAHPPNPQSPNPQPPNGAPAQVVHKPALTLAGAKTIIAAAVAAAQQKHLPGGAIAVVDDGGNLIALERLDNTAGGMVQVAIGKARTAALFKHPTQFFEDAIKNGRISLVVLPDFTPLQGGILIEVNGQVIGAIGVGGATSSQDEEIAIAGASALKSSVHLQLK